MNLYYISFKTHTGFEHTSVHQGTNPVRAVIRLNEWWTEQDFSGLSHEQEYGKIIKIISIVNR